TDDTLLSRGEKLVISARGDYLYGAPAAGDRLAAVRTLALDRHPLSELADFYFGNPADQSLLQPEELPEKKLDESGATFLELPALSDAIGSPLKITVTASLSEPGGRVVTRSLDERFWPVQNLVGIRPLFRHDRTESDAEARFEVVRANADGVLQAGEKLSATLVREEHEYYWEYNDQEGWKRQEVRNEYPVTRQPLTLAAGQKGEVAFKVGYGRYRLEVEDGDTQLKAVYAFSAGWVGDDGGQATRPDQIELKLDKAAYREGDTARLTIRPPAAGEAVVAVESDHLLWSQPLSLPPAGTEVEIPLGTGSDWARHDLYVSVVSFRPADSNQKIAPNRALGLLHLPLDRSDRRMELSISAPEKALPEKPVTVSVQAKGLEGQKAILTLSAVDAGVLNITRFKTPDPFGYYFDREAYDVDIHDDYGRIIESVDGRVLSQRFGGDAPVGLAGGALARADVQIVSLFRGAVAFDPEGKADIEVNVHATA
ncbi:MAG TPA: hypothetical protein PLN94_18355, partial [Thiolinea sp.]|nr:hypothetical protein [Thiolinea sp.]